METKRSLLIEEYTENFIKYQRQNDNWNGTYGNMLMFFNFQFKNYKIEQLEESLKELKGRIND